MLAVAAAVPMAAMMSGQVNRRVQWCWMPPSASGGAVGGAAASPTSASTGMREQQLLPRRSAAALLAASWWLPIDQAEAALQMDEDELQLMRAVSAFRKLGDFPSKAALQNADNELTTRLDRMRERGGPSMAERLAAGLSMRGAVRFRSGNADAAMKDIAESLTFVDKMTETQKGVSEVPSQVYAIRGEITAAMGKLNEGLKDYDKAVELLEELGPIEDPDLLIGRAKLRRKLGLYREASTDYGDADVILRRVGQKPLAVLEAEKSGIVLVGAGEEALDEAVERLSTVIRSTIGMLSDDIPLLQRVVLADCDARIAMAGLMWRKKQPDAAESYWRDANARLDKLVEEATKEKLTIGFPDGKTYTASRYATDKDWLVQDRLWPENLVEYLQTFLAERSGETPPQDFLLDLSIGRKPGEGSTIVERYRNRAPLF